MAPQHGIALSLAAIAVALWVAQSGGLTPLQEGPADCKTRVEDLAKIVSDKPGIEAIKNEIARAALLCTQGKTQDANVILDQVTRALKAAKITH